ncbi:MAG: ornithine carbamoyltransferase [Nitrospirota bacterium]
MKRDLLTCDALSASEVQTLMTRAAHYKANGLKGNFPGLLQGAPVGLFFEKQSTRTRASFSAAIGLLGGHEIFMPPETLQIKRGEPIADTARVFSGYFRAMVIRTFEQERLIEWARHATIPVINALSDLCHPCQAFTDLFTIFERHGKFQGLKLAYLGDGNNMAHSLMEAGAIVGMNVTIATPVGAKPNSDWHKKVQAIANKTNAKIVLTDDPKSAATNADILYTDVWVSMGEVGDKVSVVGKMKKLDFAPYQINDAIVACAKPDAMVMHCLPAHRDEEITAKVMDAHASTIFEQAKNRLPVQQAILEWALQT